MSMIKMIYFSMYFHLEVKRIISDKDKILDILLEMLLILFILD